MALIVQKYGGTSVGSTERIKNVAALFGLSQIDNDRPKESLSIKHQVPNPKFQTIVRKFV